MQKPDFVNEMGRLFRGCRCENDLTPERIAALWGEFGHEPLENMRRAVDLLLMEPGRPSRSRLDKALEQVEAESADRRASMPRGGSLQSAIGKLMPDPTLTPEFLAIQRSVSEAIAFGAKPPQIADLVESRQHEDEATDYWPWICALRNSPTWAEMPVRDVDGRGFLQLKPTVPER